MTWFNPLLSATIEANRRKDQTKSNVGYTPFLSGTGPITIEWQRHFSVCVFRDSTRGPYRDKTERHGYRKIYEIIPVARYYRTWFFIFFFLYWNINATMPKIYSRNNVLHAYSHNIFLDNRNKTYFGRFNNETTNMFIFTGEKESEGRRGKAVQLCLILCANNWFNPSHPATLTGINLTALFQHDLLLSICEIEVYLKWHWTICQVIYRIKAPLYHVYYIIVNMWSHWE